MNPTARQLVSDSAANPEAGSTARIRICTLHLHANFVVYSHIHDNFRERIFLLLLPTERRSRWTDG
jgi:hypothetical protein